MYTVKVLSLCILRIHVTSPILGERISAIILPQQRKQWLSVELDCCVQKEFIAILF